MFNLILGEKVSILSFIKRHPVLTYFIMVFVISWGGVLLVIGGPGGIAGTTKQFDRLLPVVILALLAGPSVTGILLTGLVGGRRGFRELLSRLLRWRVGVRWYAAALLTAPLLFLAILFVLSLFSPKFLPGIFTADDKTSYLLMGLATGLAAGIFEELGWTGFVIPGLRKRHNILTTGLIVGLFWAVWHLLPAIWLGSASGAFSGSLSVASYLLDPFLFLVVYRVLMVWVYDHTKSLLVAVLMHLSLTASSRILIPQGIVGLPLLIFDLVWFAVMWVVVAKVVVGSGGKLSRQHHGINELPKIK